MSALGSTGAVMTLLLLHVMSIAMAIAINKLVCNSCLVPSSAVWSHEYRPGIYGERDEEQLTIPDNDSSDWDPAGSNIRGLLSRDTHTMG